MKARVSLLLTATILLSNLPSLLAQAPEMRVWTNQQGRTVKASLVEVSGTNIVLQLESGAKSTVSIATLATSDQIYLQAMKGATLPKSPLPLGAATAPTGSQAWPTTVEVNPKALTIVEVLKDEAARKYHYQSGSFEYVSYAPLTGTVMKEVAADFELVRSLFSSLPWDWHPKPKEGTHFKVFLPETDEEFTALGGTDGSAAGSNEDYVFVRFSAMGFKKVGARYAYDARQKIEGQVVGMTTRLMLGDMRSLVHPWAMLGLEKFFRTVAYHKGTFSFLELESELKAVIKEDLDAGAKLDMKSLIASLHAPWSAQRDNAKQIRVQNYLNGLLLVYYFGFLENQGTGFHQYMREAASEAMAWRAYRETNVKSGRPQDRSKNSEDIANGFLEKLLAGRNDEAMAASLTAGFKSIGIKFED